MPFLDVAEFRELVLKRDYDAIVQQHIFAGDCYVFRDRPAALEQLRARLAKPLRGQPDDIVVVGSGKIGFSLRPENFGRSFRDESDVDVVVVNAALFDRVWTALLKWNYPRRYHLGGADAAWQEKRLDDLYWGWFRPDLIRFGGLTFPKALKPLRDLSTQWFNLFHSLGRDTEFATREFKGRLYRTWDHAALYHRNGLRKLRGAIERGEL